ncbi:MAG TPA: MaoC family dehydratase [Alphaproteobacteria bacterium]|nr:MaoC family dehydratase [Alphaproteobacteria bacterium]
MAERYFEDFKPGDAIDTAPAVLGADEMIAFARRYDPQSFHIDAEAAQRSLYGGLIASGFMTMAVTFRLFFETGALGASNMAGLGFEEVKFAQAVRPGDTLKATVTVESARPSSGRPDRGVLALRYRAFNQRGEEVLSFLCIHLVRRRPS